MQGRFFAGRRIEAGLHDGTKYQKSGKGGYDEEEDGTQRETWTNYLGTSAAEPATTASSS